jgi:hypothetical protein
MLAELTLDKEVDKLKDAKIDLEFLVVERKIIDDSLKTRGLAPANRATLTTDKTAIVAEEKRLQSKQIKLEKDVKQLRAAFVATTTNRDRCTQGSQTKREKALRNGIEQHGLKDFFVTMSSYHGGDMEGNSVHRLMGQGTEIFEEVATL